ncbi:hypothetical protein BH20ACT2_BH20ACT2_14160 [soil metagenome]
MAGRSSGRRARRTWPQRLLIGFNITVIFAALTAAAGLGYLQLKLGELQRVSLGHVLTETDGGSDEPQNYLLVGTDSAEGLDPDDPVNNGRDTVGGLRSDTTMVLRVDPGSERASLLSLPRDLWVPIISEDGQEVGNDRINTAITVGGQGALIETVEESLGIPINHYVQVDFLAFRELVDAIGGIPIYFDTAVRSRASGLFVPDPGCVTLESEQALAYVRARTDYEVFEDGDWERDPTSDFGRVSRQQDFIRRALKQSVASGIRNPAKLNEIIDVALDYVKVDSELTADDIFGLGRRFRSFNPETLDLYTLPVVDDIVGGAAVLQLLEADAQPVLDIFRGIQPGQVDPTAIRVQVLNGSGVSGQAGEATQQLNAVGFPTGTPTDAGETISSSVVRHTADRAAAADLVARYVVGGAELEEVDSLDGAEVVLVTGQDFAGIAPEPAGGGEVAPPPTEPDPDAASAGSSTTVVGEVPSEPPPEVECG